MQGKGFYFFFFMPTPHVGVVEGDGNDGCARRAAPVWGVDPLGLGEARMAPVNPWQWLRQPHPPWSTDLSGHCRYLRLPPRTRSWPPRDSVAKNESGPRPVG